MAANENKGSAGGSQNGDSGSSSVCSIFQDDEGFQKQVTNAKRKFGQSGLRGGPSGYEGGKRQNRGS